MLTSLVVFVLPLRSRFSQRGGVVDRILGFGLAFLLSLAFCVMRGRERECVVVQGAAADPEYSSSSSSAFSRGLLIITRVRIRSLQEEEVAEEEEVAREEEEEEKGEEEEDEDVRGPSPLAGLVCYYRA